jgi:hypothetical protein
MLLWKMPVGLPRSTGSSSQAASSVVDDTLQDASHQHRRRDSNGRQCGMSQESLS